MNVSRQAGGLSKWQEHFNSSWAAEDGVQTARRHGATGLYNKLLYNKEVVSLAQPVQELVGPRLPDFECDSSASAEKEEYLSSLLHSQRWLAQEQDCPPPNFPIWSMCMCEDLN